MSTLPALVTIGKNEQGETVLGRTPDGQFFYDVVMGRQTAGRLARKWKLPRQRITELRRLGRSILRTGKPR